MLARIARTKLRSLSCALLVLAVAPVLARDPPPQPTPPSITSDTVGAYPLPAGVGDVLTAVTVDLAPEASSPAHHHAGFVFAYVLAGTVRSQLNADPPRDYAVGESWIEPPGTVHASMSNPSLTEPARLLAVFVAPKGATLTMPEAAQ